MSKPLRTLRVSTPARKGVFGQGEKALRAGLYARVSTHDQKTLLMQRQRSELVPIDEALADLPGWRLHQLKGNRRGQWSGRVSGNWRIVFRFADGEAADVDLIDYH